MSGYRNPNVDINAADIPNSLAGWLRDYVRRFDPRCGLRARDLEAAMRGVGCLDAQQLLLLANTATGNDDVRVTIAVDLLSADCTACGRQHTHDGVSYVDTVVDFGHAISAAGWSCNGRRAVLAWDPVGRLNATHLHMAAASAWHGECIGPRCNVELVPAGRGAASVLYEVHHEANCPLDGLALVAVSA